jgi:hypothetical protein
MKIVFSRKGLDSGAGGFPSPIIDGRPISLPIPTRIRSLQTQEPQNWPEVDWSKAEIYHPSASAISAEDTENMAAEATDKAERRAKP